MLATLDREWDGLAAHRVFPSLPLDNNTAERAIRTPVVGRKNYSGSGARWSADLAGHAWTILGTRVRGARGCHGGLPGSSGRLMFQGSRASSASPAGGLPLFAAQASR